MQETIVNHVIDKECDSIYHISPRAIGWGESFFVCSTDLLACSQSVTGLLSCRSIIWELAPIRYSHQRHSTTTSQQQVINHPAFQASCVEEVASLPGSQRNHDERIASAGLTQLADVTPHSQVVDTGVFRWMSKNIISNMSVTPLSCPNLSAQSHWRNKHRRTSVWRVIPASLSSSPFFDVMMRLCCRL